MIFTDLNDNFASQTKYIACEQLKSTIFPIPLLFDIIEVELLGMGLGAGPAEEKVSFLVDTQFDLTSFDAHLVKPLVQLL